MNLTTGDPMVVSIIDGNPVDYGLTDYTALYSTREGYYIVHWCDKVGCDLHLVSFYCPEEELF